jgi:hypothetical protein
LKTCALPCQKEIDEEKLPPSTPSLRHIIIDRGGPVTEVLTLV